jgi:hypothetical protein
MRVTAPFTVTVIDGARHARQATYAVTILPQTPTPSYGPLTGIWEGTFQIETTSSIAGEMFGAGEITGSISIHLLEEKSGVKVWARTSNIQEHITFDNTVFGGYILVFTDWTEYGDGTVNPDGSLKITWLPWFGPLTLNVAGGVMSGSFDVTSVSPLDSIIILKRPGQKSQTVIAPVETTDKGTIKVRKVSDEPPNTLVIPTPTPAN